jgi:hypothetical protein
MYYENNLTPEETIKSCPYVLVLNLGDKALFLCKETPDMVILPETMINGDGVGELLGCVTCKHLTDLYIDQPDGETNAYEIAPIIQPSNNTYIH